MLDYGVRLPSTPVSSERIGQALFVVKFQSNSVVCEPELAGEISGRIIDLAICPPFEHVPNYFVPEMIVAVVSNAV